MFHSNSSSKTLKFKRHITVTLLLSIYWGVPRLPKTQERDKNCLYIYRLLYRSTITHWYAICLILGGPGLKYRQGTIFQNKNEKRNV